MNIKIIIELDKLYILERQNNATKTLKNKPQLRKYSESYIS